MRLILRNKNIYGLWVGIWTVSKILCILWNEGVGHAPGGPPGVPRSGPLNVPYHKEQEYIWFREGILNPTKVIMHFHFFPYKCLCDQIWPGSKIGQGHPRVTISAIYNGPTSQMLYTKFHANRLRKKRFFKGFLSYMGMAAILVMWPGPHMQTFVPPSHGGSAWNLTSIGPVVPEEKTFENVRRRRLKMWTHGRQTDRQTNSLAIW